MHLKTKSIRSWILYDAQKVGTFNQCLGLAQALELTPKLYPLTARGLWKYLPARFWPHPLKGVTPKLTPPWPDFIIGAGRQSAAPTAHIRHLSKGKTKVVQILNPRMRFSLFDLIIAPEHDNVDGENVIKTVGALTKISTQQLHQAQKHFYSLLAPLSPPLISVFIGGTSCAYTFGAQEACQLVQDLKNILQKTGGSIALTTSRRTCKSAKDSLKKELKQLPALMWDEEEESENPYLGYLALGDFLIVTCDSVSMICEACSTGKPVYLYPLPGYSKKMTFFHETILSKGHARLFQGHLNFFDAVALDETNRVASIIKHLLLKEINQ